MQKIFLVRWKKPHLSFSKMKRHVSVEICEDSSVLEKEACRRAAGKFLALIDWSLSLPPHQRARSNHRRILLVESSFCMVMKRSLSAAASTIASNYNYAAESRSSLLRFGMPFHAERKTLQKNFVSAYLGNLAQKRCAWSMRQLANARDLPRAKERERERGNESK